ncbi:MAG: DUF1080 domain-containing protein, partial [Bacteroidetes bacterium]|nr:DUF1080 domain-containing protein [Fibrella sp.]
MHQFHILIFIASCLTAHVPLPAGVDVAYQSGREVLFDGKTTTGWRGAYSDHFPAKGWRVVDGELRGELSSGAESGDAGDIVTLRKYKNFDLHFEWKLGAGGNSGVKYFVEERQP